MSGSTGASGGGRAARLAQMLPEQGLQALLVETAADLRYLTGFSGSNGIALVRAAAPGADAARRSSHPHRGQLGSDEAGGGETNE